MNEIRSILADYGRLNVDPATIGVDDDLYRAGLTSHGSVAVMLACEEEFDVEFPPNLVQRATFATIASIGAALHSLRSVAGVR